MSSDASAFYPEPEDPNKAFIATTTGTGLNYEPPPESK
jgi:hypothetical protein